jgi:hypothetical protein
MSCSSMGTEFRSIFDNSNDNNDAEATLGVAPPYVIVVRSIRSNSTTTSWGSTASVTNTGCNFISVRSTPAVSPLPYASRYFPSVTNVISQAPVLKMGVSFAIDMASNVSGTQEGRRGRPPLCAEGPLPAACNPISNLQRQAWS